MIKQNKFEEVCAYVREQDLKDDDVQLLRRYFFILYEIEPERIMKLFSSLQTNNENLRKMHSFVKNLVVYATTTGVEKPQLQGVDKFLTLRELDYPFPVAFDAAFVS